jgi:hypothetical protein
MIACTSIAYCTRTGASEEADQLAPRAVDPRQPGQAGGDRAYLRASVQNQPPAEKEDTDRTGDAGSR